LNPILRDKKLVITLFSCDTNKMILNEISATLQHAGSPLFLPSFLLSGPASY
jgi:hypothetical protein